MPTLRLTKRTVQNLGPESNAAIYWDADLSGFGVKVSPSGRKTWVVQYRQAKKTKRRSLGTSTSVPIDRARRKAGDILAAVRLGEDPFPPAATSPTLDAVADHFLEYVRAKKAPRTAADYAVKLDRYIRPAFGTRDLRVISRAEIENWHQRMAPIPRTANYALAVLVALMSFAVSRGIIGPGEHTAYAIAKYPENKRTRYLNPTEMEAFATALSELELAKRVSPWAAAAIKLLMLTGARSGEILTLRWEMVDLGHKVLRLPRSKTGAKTIVLNEAAATLLARVPKVDDVPWVIVGRHSGSPMKTIQRPFRMTCERAGISDFRVHDLRHTAASIATSAGVGLPIVGAMLGQSQAYTTARYSHVWMQSERAAAEVIGAHVGPLIASGQVRIK